MGIFLLYNKVLSNFLKKKNYYYLKCVLIKVINDEPFSVIA